MTQHDFWHFLRRLTGLGHKPPSKYKHIDIRTNSALFLTLATNPIFDMQVFTGSLFPLPLTSLEEK